MPPALLARLTGLIPSPSPSATPSGPPTPSPSPSSVVNHLVSEGQDAFASVKCTRDDISICGLTLRVTGHERLGQVLQVLLGTPLQILLIILIGMIARRLLHRLIDRLANQLGKPQSNGPLTEIIHDRIPGAGTLLGSPLTATRRDARAKTLASVLRSVTTAVIAVVLLLMILQELGLPITPLLASASVVGVAVGFGAQSLVRDVVSGMFMLIEDQYGVGDVIDVGEATGTVEAVGLRITQLRAVDGTVWYVRNGEIQRVGNSSQGWSRVVLDVPVAYGEDLDRVQSLLSEIAGTLRTDAEFEHQVLEDPEVWGVEQLTSEAVVVRVVIKTPPRQKAAVARELRRRIKTGLETNGMRLAAQPWAVAEDGGRGESSGPEQDAPEPPASEQDSQGEHRGSTTDPMGS